MNLRAQVEEDLAFTLEDPDGFGMSVTLIGPTGATQEVYGQVLYPAKIDPMDDMEVVVRKTVVTLRRSSLSPVPASGEKWSCEIPVSPVSGASTELYMIEQPTEGGESLGFIRLYLTKAKQS